MTDSFLIGCGAGFSGDRTDVAEPLVEALIADGRPSALFFETLGERTLAFAQIRRSDDPETGCEPLLEEILAPVLGRCLAAGIPIVGNFGAANPGAAARLIARLALAAGQPEARIATVTGDEVSGLAGDLSALGLDDRLEGARRLAANAYLGARPIAEALGRGAQVVVTGRCADPALALGPLVHHFGWSWEDWDRIAAGTLVGHLLECGSQVTGGYFADPGRKEVPGLERLGFPIAEVAADGSAVITKPAGTGGLVSPATVKEQLLYEIHDPAAYLTPDVVLDVTGVEVAQVGPDRVAVAGARGRPRPETLKVTVSVDGGWIGEGEISYAGPNAEARARLALEVLRKRCSGIARLRGDLIGVGSVFGDEGGRFLEGRRGTTEDLRVRIAVEDSERKAVERALREVEALLCCGPAAGGGARSAIRRRVNTWSALAPREPIEAAVEVSVRTADDPAGAAPAEASHV
ncbi:Protein of unknown function [Tistlia consotensis]|uniref:Acyclic terpene utilisation N-terminal domain-containing protein n=1 Tax=Tistlia consotensis USBA 355 TaxID=560819 RepID=A0A1Y6BQR1_9PROT|nr:acyclic terpene utilization AtuA family protein [Tistlia consotensis]SMF14685.1 Protein of unknown function [Tistlia consotensis USBA 355]SNR49331.1 Protein of unknown function [Tistlia consotensis]